MLSVQICESFNRAIRAIQVIQDSCTFLAMAIKADLYERKVFFIYRKDPDVTNTS